MPYSSVRTASRSTNTRITDQYSYRRSQVALCVPEQYSTAHNSPKIGNTDFDSCQAFVLNIAVSLGLFGCQVTAFFLLKSSGLGRRIYQPKTYLVQDRLRVEAVPVNPLNWFRRIVSIRDDELMLKCGLDGYVFLVS